MLAVIFHRWIYILIFLVALIPRVLVALSLEMTWDEGAYAVYGGIIVQNLARFNFSSYAWNFSDHPTLLPTFFGLSYAMYAFIAVIIQHGLILNLDKLYEAAVALVFGEKALFAFRLPMVILGAISCVVTYILSVDMFGDRRGGLIAAFTLAFTPLFVALTSLAALDGGVSVFYTLTIWLFYRAFKLKSTIYMILSGISLGLTFSCMLTGFGVLPVVLLWSLMISIQNLKKKEPTQIKWYWYLLLWPLLGLTIFYAFWPWLWGDPINRFLKNVGFFSSVAEGRWNDFGFYFGISALRPDFYFVMLFLNTPLILIILYLIGLCDGLLSPKKRECSLLLVLWVIIPVGILSLPYIIKTNGTRTIVFVYPALSILCGNGACWVIDRIKKVLRLGARDFAPHNKIRYHFKKGDMPGIVCAGLIMSLILAECISIHPYYLDYFNQTVGGMQGAKDHFEVGYWGEGMAEAIDYIDANAPKQSTIWIYGPKIDTLYYSSKVNFEESTKNEPFFYLRSQGGFNVSINVDLLNNIKKGDLVFYFPAYHPGENNISDLSGIKRKNMNYVLVYRFYTYPSPGILDSGNYDIVHALRTQYQAIYSVKIKNVEVCWIYKIE